MTRPSVARAASWMPSCMVGWACMVEMMSSAVASSRLAIAISAISSLASSPKMWQPRISPYGSLVITLTRPSVWPVAIALPCAWKAYLPTS